MQRGTQPGLVAGPGDRRHLVVVQGDEPPAGERVRQHEDQRQREGEREQVAQVHEGAVRA